MGAIFEFVGSFWFGGKVAGTLATKVIPSIAAQPELIQDKMMVTVSFSSFFFIMCSSVLGMPISTTHSDVGALIGSGVAALGSNAVSYSKMKRIVMSWFLSPLVAAFICFILMLIVAASTLNGAKLQIKYKIHNMIIISGLVFTVISFMLIKLITKATVFPRE